MQTRLLHATTTLILLLGCVSLPGRAAGDPNAGRLRWASSCIQCHSPAPNLFLFPAAYSASDIRSAINHVPRMSGTPSVAGPTATDLTFADGDHAAFACTVNGVAQTKQIAREGFSPPGTVCE